MQYYILSNYLLNAFLYSYLGVDETISLLDHSGLHYLSAYIDVAVYSRKDKNNQERCPESKTDGPFRLICGFLNTCLGSCDHGLGSRLVMLTFKIC